MNFLEKQLIKRDNLESHISKHGANASWMIDEHETTEKLIERWIR